MLLALRDWARRLKREVVAVHRAARDPRTPWIARIVALCVVAYALSPIDLIPDFVPVLGYLDDVVIVPLGIMLVLRLIPADVMAEHRAAAGDARLPTNLAAAAVIVALWLTGAGAAALWWFGPE